VIKIIIQAMLESDPLSKIAWEAAPQRPCLDHPGPAVLVATTINGKQARRQASRPASVNTVTERWQSFTHHGVSILAQQLLRLAAARQAGMGHTFSYCPG
jgi:hypothetical protein